MIHKLYIAIAALLLIACVSGVFLWNRYSKKGGVPRNGVPVACTTDAKICPDGSAVGRVGPSCEFAACPNIIRATSTAAINQTITGSSIRLTPLGILEDSRCPTDVVCIQAGTVRVKVVLDSEGEQKTLDMTLGKSVLFAGRTVTLTAVSPEAHSKRPIESENYRFIFSVSLSQ